MADVHHEVTPEPTAPANPLTRTDEHVQPGKKAVEPRGNWPEFLLHICEAGACKRQSVVPHSILAYGREQRRPDPATVTSSATSVSGNIIGDAMRSRTCTTRAHAWVPTCAHKHAHKHAHTPGTTK
jgi:hypothetical protein